jgi:hypothetical protein
VDDARFDSLARALAIAAPRRYLLTWLLPGAMSAPLPAAVGAAKSCPPCRKRKRGKCRKHRPDGSPCGTANRCRDGRCDYSVCAFDCAGEAIAQPCGPAKSSCQCVNTGGGVGACAKRGSGVSCNLATPACPAGEVCGIPCTTYLPSCWKPCA